jgi:spermidine synthase
MRFVLTVLFFVSGATALVCQSLWLKSFSVVFGNSTYAAAAVVSVFMGGLALGSYLAGRVVDRTNHHIDVIDKLCSRE